MVQRIVAATMRIRGRPEAAALTQPATVRLSKGDILVLVARYSFEEQSGEKEGWEFTLGATISLVRTPDARTAMPIVGVRHDDRRARRDGLQGELERELVFEHPGEYTVRYEAEAEYSRLGWGAATLKSLERKSAVGHIHVHVF